VGDWSDNGHPDRKTLYCCVDLRGVGLTTDAVRVAACQTCCTSSLGLGPSIGAAKAFIALWLGSQKFLMSDAM
jgi:hypothetical protein